MAKDSEYKDKERDEEEGSSLRLKDLFAHYLRKWYWFALSVILCLGVAVYYLLTTPKVYTTSAELLVKETSGKKGTTDFGNFDSFDLFQQKSNINNELATLSSPDLMEDVVKILNLEVNYQVKGKFHDQVIYGEDLPVNVYINADSVPADIRSMTFNLKFTPEQQVTISAFKVNGDEVGFPESKGAMSNPLPSPAGDLVVVPSTHFPGEYNDIKVSWICPEAATKKYNNELVVSQDDEKSSIINIAVRDVNTARAKDIISTLISVYNKKWVDDKNQIAQSTSNFISERLKVIESELGDVDNEISDYKSENLLPDINAASDMYLKQANDATAEILQLNNQLEMANSVRQYLLDPAKQQQLVPVNTGFESPSLTAQINTYNQKVLDRNSLIANSSETNPIVIDMDQALVEMRSNIVNSIDQQIEALRGKIRTQQQQQGQAISHISSNPQQAKYLLSVERQQMVKESLYLFLLQKREENELSQAFTAYNTRIIAEPRTSENVTPVNRNIYLLALVIGLLIPAVILYMRIVLNSKVRGRKDLDGLPTPFVGEIPNARKKKLRLLPAKKKAEDVSSTILVKEGSRNVINEAFRVIRANLEFMMGDQAKVIAMTSFNPGSGKTFISLNMAISMALKGKRVLAVDLDLRKGSLSKYAGSPKRGITDYIVGKEKDLDSLIVKQAADTKLDLLPMGTMPPNPTELLYNERFHEAIAELRQQYDIILLDCPPAEIVADATIINKEADFTLFIIRAGLFERDMLGDLKDFYRTGKFKNLSVILNGTENSGGRYGSRYGYRYGYGHYGGYTKED